MRRSRLFVDSIGVLVFACLCSLPLVAQEPDEAEAPKLVEPSAGARVDYSTAGNLQNAREFRDAGEAWERFLKKHPNTTLTPKAQYYAGVCWLSVQDYAKAVPHFQAVTTKWAKVPKLDVLQEAYLNLGACHYSLAESGKTKQAKAKSYDQAAAAFADLAKQFPMPEGKYVDKALYYLGESLYLHSGLVDDKAAKQKKQQAVIPYAKVVKEHPKSALRVNALYALGVTYQELGQYTEAGDVYDKFIAEFAEDRRITEVKMRKGETVFQAGLAIKDDDKAQANELFSQAATMFAETASVEGFNLADHALSQQALCLYNQDKFVESAKLYAKLITEFPKSVYVSDATINAGRFFYRGEAFKEAAPWLQKVVDKDPANAAEAAHWLCRVHLRNNEAAQAADLAAKVLPKAGNSSYSVYLKMDQADAVYAISKRRAESLPLYVAIGTEHAKHELAPQAWYNAAYTALDLKKYDEALTHAAAFLKDYENHVLAPDTKYVAAECNLMLKKYPDAEAAYRDLATNYKKHADLQLWQVRVGLCLYFQEKYKDVIEFLAPLVGKLKAPAEGHFLIGASHFSTENYKETVAALSASLKANAKWEKADETLLYLSQAQHKLGQTDDAIASIKKILADFPNSQYLDQAHYRLGEYAYAKKDYKLALAEYGVVIEKWPKSLFAPFAYFGNGWSLLQTKKYAPAIESFTELLTKFPKHGLAADSNLARGMCRRQTGDNKGAAEDLTAFLKTNPARADKSSAQYELGLAQSALKDYAGAAASFSAVLKEDPKSEIADKVTYELAWAHKSGGKDAQALAQFSKLIASYPNSPLAAESHFHVGEDLYAKKSYDKAAEQYTESKKKSKSAELTEKAVYKLGWSHYQQKHFANALKEFQDQVKTFGKGKLAADGLFMVAECHYSLDDFAQAYPAYESAKAAVDGKEGIPDDVKILILLHGGTSAVETQKVDEALKLLQAIPETDKDSPLLAEAFFEIGRALKGQEKYDDAVTELEKAYDKSGEQGKLGLRARARFEIGEILFAQKKYDAAIKEFRLVMNGFGKSPPDDVKKWQAYAGYEAGRCAFVRIKGETKPQVKKKLIADAKTYYSYVIENHPESTPAVGAKKDLDVLAKL